MARSPSAYAPPIGRIMGRFNQGRSIFDNLDVLHDGYVPDELMEREEEEEKMLRALMPIANGDTPTNTFIYGDSGAGKTVATRMLLDELKEDTQEFDDVDVRIVWQNCQDRTSYETAVGLVNNFRDADDQLPEQGYSRSAIYNKLWDAIENCDATHVVFVLDEVDSLGTDDKLLYQLPRARSNNNLKHTKIGLIGISNDFTYRENLSASVSSSLCEKEIYFQPYDANQLRPILKQHAEKAFVNGALDDVIIPRIAALAAKDTGSARHALDILRQAGDVAISHDSPTVTDQHVEAAQDEVQRGRHKDDVKHLPRQSQAVLYALLLLDQENSLPAEKGDVYERYEIVCKRIGTDTKAIRTIHNRLNTLAQKGFVQLAQRNEGRDGGIYNTYTLDIQTNIVEEALAEAGVIETDNESETLDGFN